MQHTGLRESAKYRPVLRIAIHQTFGMKLQGQQERKQGDRFWLQFHSFHNSISADRGHLQRSATLLTAW